MSIFKEIMGWLWALLWLFVAFVGACAVGGLVVGYGFRVAAAAFRFWN